MMHPGGMRCGHCRAATETDAERRKKQRKGEQHEDGGAASHWAAFSPDAIAGQRRTHNRITGRIIASDSQKGLILRCRAFVDLRMSETDSGSCKCTGEAGRAEQDLTYRRALCAVVPLNTGFGVCEIIGGFVADSQA